MLALLAVALCLGGHFVEPRSGFVVAGRVLEEGEIPHAFISESGGIAIKLLLLLLPEANAVDSPTSKTSLRLPKHPKFPHDRLLQPAAPRPRLQPGYPFAHTSTRHVICSVTHSLSLFHHRQGYSRRTPD